MARIDAHAHVVPSGYREQLELAGSFLPPPAEVPAIEAMMDRYEIDAAVISSGPPGASFADPRTNLRVARLLNEELAEIVAAAPARFAALASLPLPDVEAALAELGHALGELGLDGVTMLSNEGGLYPGDPRLEPLMAELDRRAALVFVHPTTPPYEPPLPHPPWLYEFPFETTRMVTNLVYSGVFERYPSIRWQLPHLGGTAPFLAPRLGSLAEREPAMASEAPRGAIEYLRRAHYDTGLANSEATVRAALLTVPPERIVFGTDWPYAVLPASPGDPAPELSFLSAGAREDLDAGHVASLVPRLARLHGLA